jgi:hypothetical protein
MITRNDRTEELGTSWMSETALTFSEEVENALQKWCYGTVEKALPVNLSCLEENCILEILRNAGWKARIEMHELDITYDYYSNCKHSRKIRKLIIS